MSAVNNLFLSSLAIGTNNFGVSGESGANKIVCTSSVSADSIYKERSFSAFQGG